MVLAAAATLSVGTASATDVAAPPPPDEETILEQNAPSSTAPRIVLQAEGGGGVEVAAWTLDDHYLITASGFGGMVTIWDVTTGLIIDRLHLPGSGGTTRLVRLTEAGVAEDGKTVKLQAIVLIAAKEKAIRMSDYYELNLASRTITARAVKGLVRFSGATAEQMRAAHAQAEDAKANAAFEAYFTEASALGALYEGGTDMTVAQAKAALPKLPQSHSGGLTLRREVEGLDIVDASGKLVRRLHAPPATSYDDAALSPDGRVIALVDNNKVQNKSGAVTTKVNLFDTISATALPTVTLAGDYGRVEWLDATRLVVTPAWDANDRVSEDPLEQGIPVPARIVDARSGRETPSPPIASRCFMAALGNDVFVGAGLSNCRGKVMGDFDLVRIVAGGKWQPLAAARAAGKSIITMAVSRARQAVAVGLQSVGGKFSLAVVDANTGADLGSVDLPGVRSLVALAFGEDGKALTYAADGELFVWTPGNGAPRALDAKGNIPQVLVSDGKSLLVTGAASSMIARFDLASGAALAPVDHRAAIAGGFLPGKPIYWSVSTTDGLRLFDTTDWHVMLTTYQFDRGGFVAVTPDGRYDTNLGPDAAPFRWLVPDEPFQSLAPQTFMRDYFEPRLTQRLFDCTTAGNCGDVLKPLPPMTSLNRALPKVEITSIEPGKTPDRALVNFTITETVSSNGRFRSGVYNPRLFRNNRFVAHDPDKSDAVLETLDDWRKLNEAKLGGDPPGASWQFDIPVPTGPGTEKQEFSLYAFNSDRVKSDTAHFTYIRPKVAPKRPRAFIVTIGIDAYDLPRLALNFAASDAQLLADRLAQIPGYDVRRASLLGRADPDGKVLRVTQPIIDATLGILAGFPPAESINRLRDLGVDASQLDNSTPDDIVIIAFSGHGWADKQGNFYLVPAEGNWPKDAETPDVDTLVSSARLTMWLRAIQAADIAFVIDACHSAASVDAKGFKPGPMGDSGLGQLAFDKGIRILAATQASDVALEDPNLRQGLLTYALASEGITEDGGKADLNNDGRITLDEWLRYAVRRLPSLSTDVRLGRFGALGASGSRTFAILSGTPNKAPKVQEPSLFDFTNAPSPVVLRNVRP